MTNAVPGAKGRVHVAFFARGRRYFVAGVLRHLLAVACAFSRYCDAGCRCTAPVSCHETTGNITIIGE